MVYTNCSSVATFYTPHIRFKRRLNMAKYGEELRYLVDPVQQKKKLSVKL